MSIPSRLYPNNLFVAFFHNKQTYRMKLDLGFPRATGKDACAVLGER